jgi:Fic family protein
MEKVLSHPRLSHCLPNYVLLAHLAKTQREVLSSLTRSIDANRLVQFNMSLVNKNVLLTTTTLNVSEGNTRNVAKILGIHPRLIRATNFWR